MSRRECKLGECIEVINGYAFKSQNFLEEQIENSLPVVKIKNVANGDVNLKAVQFHLFDKNLEKYLIQKNDVLIALTGNHPQAITQVVGEVSKYKLGELAFLNQRVAKIKARENMSNDFLYYFLKDDASHDYLASQSSGSANQANISKSDIENMPISLPHLEEQKAIAEVLSSLDDKIDLLHRQNQTLESLAQTLFRQWFIEEAKEEWEEKPLSFFGDIICGKTPSKSNSQYFDGNVPFIKIPDMHGNTFIFKTTDTLSEVGKESQKNKTLPAKSICVSCIATVGLVSMNIIESQTNQQINSIVTNKDIYRYFLYLFMKSSYELLHTMASGGTATLNLNTGDFSKMEILKPDNETLQKFHKIIEPTFDKIFINSKQIQTLENLRDILLPKLLSGEIRVKFDN
ncbi:restriction endonuclease subunit S [Aliarcobacter cryaerophilus]|uniref:restriction endonuclease subunit S n=1 Tax=Aliarcobacter cryaerophilus TaxID=28198 RepID=UPI0021B6AB38|nr:restriction endonuclease subunit S [Aliarcobacter cryaerophilus]MCT7542453.1 restriction endonuclease subunit S [Aliarcobacter cryaerophilus]